MPHYYHMDTVTDTLHYTIDNTLNEDKIWRFALAPRLNELAPNVHRICQYGVTEMLNNALEHSGSKDLTINVSITAQEVRFDIIDNGVGIFIKIQNEMNLDDPRHSILELVKGKFTSDPQNHSGEGIFFTSRVFDRFSIHSGRLIFAADSDGDRLLEGSTEHEIHGTAVSMTIQKKSTRIIADIFNEYIDPDKLPGFFKTAIPLKLMECDGDTLMSRSQAKRLITRFDRFLEVVLDFSGVDFIGQGFTDEIFRVFANAHPEVKLRPINCGKNAANMIRHVGATVET